MTHYLFRWKKAEIDKQINHLLSSYNNRFNKTYISLTPETLDDIIDDIDNHTSDTEKFNPNPLTNPLTKDVKASYFSELSDLYNFTKSTHYMELI